MVCYLYYCSVSCVDGLGIQRLLFLEREREREREGGRENERERERERERGMEREGEREGRRERFMSDSLRVATE